jgi:hypothetical protein
MFPSDDCGEFLPEVFSHKSLLYPKMPDFPLFPSYNLTLQNVLILESLTQKAKMNPNPVRLSINIIWRSMN